jgi:hypothetical protein
MARDAGPSIQKRQPPGTENPIDTWQLGAASGVALLALIAIRELARTTHAGPAQRLARALVIPVALLFAVFTVISVARIVQILAGIQ